MGREVEAERGYPASGSQGNLLGKSGAKAVADA